MQTKHLFRTSINWYCQVCGVPAGTPCEMGEKYHRDQEQKAQAKDNEAWLEFQLMAVLHSLRVASPNHYLVRVFDTAMSPAYEGDSLPVFMRKQAD